MENYGEENVMCNYLKGVKKNGTHPTCYVKDAFGEFEETHGDTRLYIEGESNIFLRRPELKAMFESDLINEIMPGEPIFTQVFAGFPGMGSDIHAAVGINLFRQLAGKKKWYLVPQSQSAYVFASVNPWDHFSAWTKTKVGKGNEPASPWFKKVKRYMVVLEPGDILLNTAWTWHGVANLGSDPDELVIGVPTRYATRHMIPAMRSNPVLTSIALVAMIDQYGGIAKFFSRPDNLQDGIQRARDIRRQQELLKME